MSRKAAQVRRFRSNLEDTHESVYTDPLTGITHNRTTRGLREGAIHINDSRLSYDELVEAELWESYVEPSAEEIQQLTNDMENVRTFLARNVEPLVAEPVTEEINHINYRNFPTVFEQMEEAHAKAFASSCLSRSVIRFLQPFCNMDARVGDMDKWMTFTFLKNEMLKVGMTFVSQRGDEMQFRFDSTDVYKEVAELEEYDVILKALVLTKSGIDHIPTDTAMRIKGMPLNMLDPEDKTLCVVTDYWFETATKK